MDTVEANVALGFEDDARKYDIAAEILNDLGIKNVKLITNNPKKISALEKYGINIIERISVETIPTERNLNYLKTKIAKLGHTFDTI